MNLPDYFLSPKMVMRLRMAIHDVSAFTIGNTLTDTWRGVRVMRSYSSIDKPDFLCVLTIFFTRLN